MRRRLIASAIATVAMTLAVGGALGATGASDGVVYAAILGLLLAGVGLSVWTVEGDPGPER